MFSSFLRALRALRAKLFCILENAWERRTLVRHVFYVFIFLCALRVLRANPSFLPSRSRANLKIGVPSMHSVPSVFSVRNFFVF